MQTSLQAQLLSQGKFSAEDLACIAQCRGAHNRLGFAYQLAFVRLFNHFPPQQSFATRDELLTFVSLQLDIDISVMRTYSQRRETVAEHQERIRLYLGLSRFSAESVPQVERFIFEEASRLEETSLLLAQTKRFLREHHILEPADDTLRRLIQQQRQQARTQIFVKITAAASPALREQLDQLVTPSAAESARRSPLHLLKQPPGRPSPAALLKLTGKLERIKATGVLDCDLNWLNNNFQRSLARYARQYTAFRLRELQPERRYAVLVCFLRQLYRDTIDAIVDMYDKLLNQVYNRAQRDVDDHAKAHRKQLRTSLTTFKTLAELALDESIEQLREAVFAVIGKETLIDQVAEVETWLSGKHSHVFNLVVARFSYLRQFAPALLEHLQVEMEADTSSALPEAMALLRQLNQAGKRTLPEEVPSDFLPKGIQRLITQDGSLSKPAWECAVLTAIRDEIKSGNVAVKDSKRFGRLDDFFMPESQWQRMREAFFRRAKLPLNPSEARVYLTERLNAAYDRFLERLPDNPYAQVDEDGWSVSKDSADKLSAEEEQRLDRLKAYLADHMRVIKLPALLIEVDNELHFTRHFMTARQQQQPQRENICEILATLMAHGCNIGPYTMAHLIEGVSYHRIKHISDWLLSGETLRGALAGVVNAISRLDISQAWGDGTTSSSDGQRFALRRKVLQQTYSHPFNDFAIEFYSFVADNYAPYYSIPHECTDRDAPYVLDGLLYNESDLAIEEHYTDTHGFTDTNFAAFAMLGKRFTPRIKALHEHAIFRIDTAKDYGPLGVLVDRKDRTLQLDWIVEQWDRMGHFYASLEHGHATASTALKRLNGFAGKNHFYRANRELGRIFRTEHTLDFMSDQELRKRNRRGLLKGEQIHALARDLNYGKRGASGKADWQGQLNSCSCLTLIMACIIYWQAKEIHRVILAADPHSEVDFTLVPHLSPIAWENVILYGEYVLDRTLIKLRQRSHAA